MEQLIELLKNSGCDDFSIKKSVTRSHEFFFIRHKLDMNRRKEVSHTLVTVYKDIEDQYRGSSSFEIYPGSSKEEIQKRIEEGVYAASFVKNPRYSLAEGTAPHVNTQSFDARETAMKFIRILQSLPETETEDINSYEIFVNEKQIRLINSRGIDVTYNALDCEAEVILNARLGDHEIELYRDFTSGSCDEKLLRRRLMEAMQTGKDRCLAKPMPKLGQIKVLFSSEDAVQFAKYLIDLSDASNRYMQISLWELEKPIAEKLAAADTVTLKALKYLENSSTNFPFDNDGLATEDRLLIENGIFKNYHGSKQFSDYIGCPSGIAYNFIFEGGTKEAAELRQSAYLEAVEFSDFQVDTTTGEFAGEIRLAYYFDGKAKHIVSGGSLSGNMKDALKNWCFTAESVQYDNLVIPKIIAIDNVSITGIE